MCVILVIMSEDAQREKVLKEKYEQALDQLSKLLKELKEIESNLPPNALTPETKAKRETLCYNLVEPQKRAASYGMGATIIKKDDLDEMEQKVNILKKLKF
jgi:hypothetical protein